MNLDLLGRGLLIADCLGLAAFAWWSWRHFETNDGTGLRVGGYIAVLVLLSFAAFLMFKSLS